jgi:hypothetical protein
MTEIRTICPPGRAEAMTEAEESATRAWTAEAFRHRAWIFAKREAISEAALAGVLRQVADASAAAQRAQALERWDDEGGSHAPAEAVGFSAFRS